MGGDLSTDAAKTPMTQNSLTKKEALIVIVISLIFLLTAGAINKTEIIFDAFGVEGRAKIIEKKHHYHKGHKSFYFKMQLTEEPYTKFQYRFFVPKDLYQRAKTGDTMSIIYVPGSSKLARFKNHNSINLIYMMLGLALLGLFFGLRAAFKSSERTI